MDTVLFQKDGFTLVQKSKGAFSQVRVLYDNNKRASSTYTFPNVACDFQSPYLSWENLLHCGGFQVKDDYLKYIAVQQGKKLYAGFGYFTHQHGTPRHKIDDEISRITEALPEDCEFGLEEPQNHNLLNYYVCRKGAVKDYIDIDNALLCYKQMGLDLRSEDDCVKRYCAIEMRDFSQSDKIAFDYGNPSSIGQYIVTGLLLGYPLASTYSLIS